MSTKLAPPPMALRLEELAKTIDLALLDPAAESDDIRRAAATATDLHLASVVVLPQAVAEAVALLRGCDVKVCAVVGFPAGASAAKAKVAAAECCIAAGAGELELVLNVRAMVTGDFRLVRDEVAAVVRAIRLSSVNAGRGVVLLRAVLETGQLDDKRMKLACRIVENAGVDFAQTSTEYDGGTTAVHDVELLRESLSENVGVKAAGGIDTAEDAVTALAAGASRIGVASAARLVVGAAVGEPV